MKKHLKKIVISIMLVVIITFAVMPPSAHAIDPGGILIKPFTSIAVSVLDTINGWMTYFIVGVSNGFASWGSDTVDEILDALADQSTYASLQDSNGNITVWSVVTNLNDVISIGASKIYSCWVCMDDFFTGKINLANINIFKDINEPGIFSKILDFFGMGTLTGDIGTNVLIAIKASVASWYYALRNLAALGLLCALIFNAIRILLSSVADEKAHYKMQLIDWAKAACLVIFLHLIMILILDVGDALIKILSHLNSRFTMLAYIRGKLTFNFSMNQIGYLVLYGMLTYYTLAFAISYFKRFFYTMILIVIAPIVSLLYAFGKQGKDIFNKWLKEFVYNTMLQPYHLLIYTLLFGWVASILQSGSSSDIFVVIYACIVAHFIKDAEKYYRSLFGMGQGVAGIGPFDTGDKVIKDVSKKVVDTVKTVVTTAAAVLLPGGAMLAGAKGVTMASQANNAGQAARNIAGTAQQFKGVSVGGGNTPPRNGEGPFGGLGGGENPPVVPGGSGGAGGPSGMPGGTTGTMPDANGFGDYQFANSYYDLPYLEGNNMDFGNSDVQFSVDQLNSGENRFENNEQPNGNQNTNPEQRIGNAQMTTQGPITDDGSIEYKNGKVTMQGPTTVSDLSDLENAKLNNNGSDLSVNQLNANEAKLGKVDSGRIKSDTNRIERDSRKINARLEAGAIDKIINTLTGKSHTSVLPGQAPSTTAEQGQDLGLRNTINTIDNLDNAKQRMPIDENMENIEKLEFEDNEPTRETLISPSSDAMKAAIANEILTGTKSSKNEGGSVNANIEQEANVTQNISSNNSHTSNLQYKSDGDITKQIESVMKRNGGKINNIDELANRVAEKTGKSSEEVKKMIEGTYEKNGKVLVLGETINRTEIAAKGTNKLLGKDDNLNHEETTSSSSRTHVEGSKTQNLLEDNNTE